MQKEQCVDNLPHIYTFIFIMVLVPIFIDMIILWDVL